jgi:F-type H+-transporting ATPase subunit a
MPEISIKAEKIFELFGVEITNSLLLSVAVIFVFTLIAIKYFLDSYQKGKTTFFYFVNFLLKSLYQLFQSILKEKIDYFFPLLGSFFLFILFQNWFGLLPGVGSVLINHLPLLRGGNADLNTTLSLALLSVVLTQIFGIKYLGWRAYLGKFINFANPITFFTGVLEIISELSKIISFSFRLFGNIFAGEVLLTIMAFLVPILASFPFLLLEVFVGLIQALVFSMLTAVFLNLAISKQH